jgi:hypothetical protein
MSLGGNSKQELSRAIRLQLGVKIQPQYLTRRGRALREEVLEAEGDPKRPLLAIEQMMGDLRKVLVFLISGRVRQPSAENECTDREPTQERVSQELGLRRLPNRSALERRDASDRVVWLIWPQFFQTP